MGKLLRIRWWKSSKTVSNKYPPFVVAICRQHTLHQNTGATPPYSGFNKVPLNTIQYHRLTGIA